MTLDLWAGPPCKDSCRVGVGAGVGIWNLCFLKAPDWECPSSSEPDLATAPLGPFLRAL